jgi:hypothetical protein
MPRHRLIDKNKIRILVGRVGCVGHAHLSLRVWKLSPISSIRDLRSADFILAVEYKYVQVLRNCLGTPSSANPPKGRFANHHRHPQLGASELGLSILHALSTYPPSTVTFGELAGAVEAAVGREVVSECWSMEHLTGELEEKPDDEPTRNRAAFRLGTGTNQDVDAFAF